MGKREIADSKIHRLTLFLFLMFMTGCTTPCTVSVRYENGDPVVGAEAHWYEHAKMGRVRRGSGISNEEGEFTYRARRCPAILWAYKDNLWGTGNSAGYGFSGGVVIEFSWKDRPFDCSYRTSKSVVESSYKMHQEKMNATEKGVTH